MIKKFIVLFIALFFICEFSKALECYHCYVNNDKEIFSPKNSEYVECNKNNMTASNTWSCPNNESKCVFQKVETPQGRQVWRSCSNGYTDPCDPNYLPPNTKLVDCKTCTTDKCNLMAEEEKNSTLTFNINANINLYIKQ